MPIKRVFITGLIALSIPLTVLAGTAEHPVVVPWSVDNTQAQSQIRQYEAFKAMNQNGAPQIAPTTNPYSYNYQNTLAAGTQAGNPYVTPVSLPEKASSENSTLEDMYSHRINNKLRQFGYELFGIPDNSMRDMLSLLAQKSPSIPSGAVQDDFMLGEGDELTITLSGQRSARENIRIDSEGLLVIPDFPPIPAAGRSIGQVRISLETAAAQIHNTQVHVSLSGVRQIGIIIVGHIKKPGRKTMTVFHTVLDALMESGGIEKTGSLRQIKLVRDGHSTFIDLYDLLMHGATAMDLQLKDGDRIIVPPIGPTVAITGEVKRPGIYEILPSLSMNLYKAVQSSEKLSLNDMLGLAGGVLAPGKIRYLKLGITDKGLEQVEDINDTLKPQFSDGSILMISKGQERRAGMVELQGHTLRPGLYALTKNKTLSSLLSGTDLLDSDIYPLIGVIERFNEEQLTRTLLDFPLQLVLSKKFDRRLQEGDTIHLFSNAQIEGLTREQETNEKDNSLLHTISLGSREAPENETQNILEDEVMAGFLKERSLFLRGAVRKPGAYPISEGLSLATVLATAGGLALEANTANIEVTSAHNGASTYRQRINFSEQNPNEIILSPGDSVRVNQKFDKIADNSVLVMGEVENPGRYDLLPGDKVSDLIERAGGMTQQAYPYGAVFSRESQRRAEELRFKSQARAIEQSIAAALEVDEEKINAGKIAEARALADELKNAQGVGRITVETDPGKLADDPALDMLLESGDKLFIPRRGLTVRVSGEVLSPASLQFREKKPSLDYINEAGGFTYNADKDRTFVIYPDGSAQPLAVSSWNYNPVMIPPGSTIVVPRDPKPFDFIQSAKDVSQILSNLAVTAIFIDDLKDDN